MSKPTCDCGARYQRSPSGDVVEICSDCMDKLKNGHSPVRGGQGRSDASVWANGWVILIVWTAAFFVVGVLVGIAL